MSKRRYEERLRATQNRIFELSDKKDYGICPAPVTDESFVKEIIRYFLGDKWFVALSISHQQINHEALVEIEMKYKGFKKKGIEQK